MFAYENYCKDKSDFLSGAKERELVKKEVYFLAKGGAIQKVAQDGLIFVIENGKATLALYKGKDKEINIPQTVKGCPVTKIGDYCFYINKTVEKVTIPSTVEEIGKKAFYWSWHLTSIEFEPNSQLKIIGNSAFRECNELSEITIPKSVERIGDDAFYSCSNLENIAFEKREKPIFIEPSIFSSCPFSNIDFTHNVEFGKDTLSFAENLKKLTFTGPGEIKKENILKFLPCNVATKFFKHNIEKLFAGQDSIQIDDKLTIDLWGGCLKEGGTLDLSQFDVATFKTFKFYRNNCVKRVNWPQGIDVIPNDMFRECKSLEEITIPNTVNELASYAFYHCEKLAKVIFEAGRTEDISVYLSIFENCVKIKEVTIPDKIILDSRAINGYSVKRIIIDADTENVQFNDYCFGSRVSEDLRIYVRDNAMKEKITKNKRLNVKPENVIVGQPPEDE